MHIPPDWGIFSTLIVSFLIFWFIFGGLFFGPFLDLIGARERRLKELGERTERLLREEKAALADREAQLAAVRREAIERREGERRRAEQEAVHMIQEARAEAKAQLDNMRAGIENEFAAAAGQLEQLAQSLAADLAERVLGRPVRNGRASLGN
jgi:F0F1-type ATP synthase membrane subunit b/b'